MPPKSTSALEDVLSLERLETNMFRGPSPQTTMQRIFGGQVAGQALVAATRTVEHGLLVHSLHGYFIRPGSPAMPTVYLVERLRDGRSFVTRRVTGMQNGETIFSMAASFHRGDPGPEHADAMPPVPDVHDLDDSAVTDRHFDEWHKKEWPDWDIRRVPQERVTRRDGVPAQQQVWLKHVTPLPDDAVFHVCALAYASDMTLLGSALLTHGEVPTQVASLDHAMWFLRPFRADDWLLYDQTSPSAGHGRGLTQGRIFDRAGRLIAAVVQEGLVRTERST
jgi:acyl-CoA thioesterase-2